MRENTQCGKLHKYLKRFVKKKIVMSNSQTAIGGTTVKIRKDLEGFEKCSQSRDCRLLYRLKKKKSKQILSRRKV